MRGKCKFTVDVNMVPTSRKRSDSDRDRTLYEEWRRLMLLKPSAEPFNTEPNGLQEWSDAYPCAVNQFQWTNGT